MVISLYVCTAKRNFFCRITLQEVMDMLDCNQIRDFNTAIFVEPPDVHELTDEDSGDEDDADTNRSSGNQLRAPAIISDVSGGDNCNPLDEVPIIAPP